MKVRSYYVCVKMVEYVNVRVGSDSLSFYSQPITLLAKQDLE